MASSTNSEIAIFERIVLPDQSAGREETAHSILSMQFSPEDRHRMEQLAEKSKLGPLSPDEEIEAETYERVGHYLAILQSKARVALKSGAAGPS